jgi:hypothetical protein
MTDAHAPAERVLSEAQRSYLEAWLRETGDNLGLRDWTITATAYIAHDNGMASSFIRNRSDTTEIAVARDFAAQSPDAQRATLVHELLHPHFHRITQLAVELIENELGKRTEAVIDTALTFQEELAIERLAKAIAPFYPPVNLPPGDPAESH